MFEAEDRRISAASARPFNQTFVPHLQIEASGGRVGRDAPSSNPLRIVRPWRRGPVNVKGDAVFVFRVWTCASGICHNP